MAKMPALTTATACSSAVTGVGATPAEGSQAWKGNTAAFTPKPKKPSRKPTYSSTSWPAARPLSRLPPARKARPP